MMLTKKQALERDRTEKLCTLTYIQGGEKLSAWSNAVLGWGCSLHLFCKKKNCPTNIIYLDRSDHSSSSCEVNNTTAAILGIIRWQWWASNCLFSPFLLARIRLWLTGCSKLNIYLLFSLLPFVQWPHLPWYPRLWTFTTPPTLGSNSLFSVVFPHIVPAQKWECRCYCAHHLSVGVFLSWSCSETVVLPPVSNISEVSHRSHVQKNKTNKISWWHFKCNVNRNTFRWKKHSIYFNSAWQLQTAIKVPNISIQVK